MPLTVERGKIVLAEFTHGGKVAPRLPAWLLKARIWPPLYSKAMLKGRESMARPELADR